MNTPVHQMLMQVHFAVLYVTLVHLYQSRLSSVGHVLQCTESELNELKGWSCTMNMQKQTANSLQLQVTKQLWKPLGN